MLGTFKQEAKRPRLLYIAGSGRSGSTLLDLLISNHPRVAGLGEVHRVGLQPEKRKCACGEVVSACPFWGDVIGELVCRHELSPNHWHEEFRTTVVTDRIASGLEKVRLMDIILLLGSRNLLFGAGRISENCASHVEVGINSWRLYNMIGKCYDVDVVVDSTKNAARMKLLYMLQTKRVWVIHLIRDGRGVADSARRRLGQSIAEGATKWKRANRNVELAAATIPSQRKLRVRYEELCDSTERTLRRICQFSGINYDHRMLSLKATDYHQIPGNPMLFRRGETTIVKDERWRARMEQSDLREFVEVAGRLNQRYGYD